jgi:type II secretory pathway component PulL
MNRNIQATGIAMVVAMAMSVPEAAQAQNTGSAPFQIVEASIDDIHMALRSGRLTARQLVQLYLDRIERLGMAEPPLKALAP